MIKKRKISRLAKEKKILITKKTLIGDLINKYPASASILLKHGFHCLGCAVSPYESLEAGAAAHGIPLKPLLSEINKSLNK